MLQLRIVLYYYSLYMHIVACAMFVSKTSEFNAATFGGSIHGFCHVRLQEVAPDSRNRFYSFHKVHFWLCAMFVCWKRCSLRHCPQYMLYLMRSAIEIDLNVKSIHPFKFSVKLEVKSQSYSLPYQEHLEIEICTSSNRYDIFIYFLIVRI